MTTYQNASPYERLTDQELIVLQLITKGKSDSEIREYLYLNSRKTDFLIQSIYLKLNLKNKNELLMYVENFRKESVDIRDPF